MNDDETKDLIERTLCEIKKARDLIAYPAIDLPPKGITMNVTLAVAAAEVILGTTAGTRAFRIKAGQAFAIFTSGTLLAMRLIAIDGTTITTLPIGSLPNARVFRVGGDDEVRTLALTPSAANTRVTLWLIN